MEWILAWQFVSGPLWTLKQKIWPQRVHVLVEEIINEQDMYTKEVYSVTRWYQQGRGGLYTEAGAGGVFPARIRWHSQSVTWGLVRIVYVAKWETMQQWSWARQSLANQPMKLESWQGEGSNGNVAGKSRVQNKGDRRRFWQVLSTKTYTSRTLTCSRREMSMTVLAEWLSLHNYPRDLCRSIHTTYIVIRIWFQKGCARLPG